MKLEEILTEWEKDAPIDRTKLGESSIDTAKLHAKYLRFMTTEKMALAKYKGANKELYLRKLNYFTGRMTDAEREELGWEINPLRILKNEADDYIQADREYINDTLKVALQQEKVDALDSILRAIGTRQFSIKNAIDWARLMNGG